MYNTDFIRSKSQAIYQKNKNWAGSRLDLEDYRVKEVQTQLFQTLSQKYSEIDVFAGRGDTLNMFVELGYKYRRSEEHTSELQSRPHLVCRLLLEKKKKI